MPKASVSSENLTEDSKQLGKEGRKKGSRDQLTRGQPLSHEPQELLVELDQASVLGCL